MLAASLELYQTLIFTVQSIHGAFNLKASIFVFTFKVMFIAKIQVKKITVQKNSGQKNSIAKLSMTESVARTKSECITISKGEK